LSGRPGLISSSSFDNLLSSNDSVIKEVENGADLVLTVDRSIQFFICQALEDALKNYQASSGTIIILDSKTSAVLAFCNKPDFNPNKYYEAEKISLFKNSGISSVYEPGSIFKVITLASALDAEKITPQTTYYDYGYIKLDGETIRNANERSYGTQTMSGVLEKSINTGAVFAAQSLGRSSFRNYLKKFGFGSLTGIELAGEAVGNIDNLDKKQEIYLATASFGQGISVTPIQMINAMAAIANQGKLMKPYVVDSFIKDGEIVHRQPEFIRQVVSPSAASTITSIMVSTCENGYGQRAKVKNYYVAGKTGTAQVPKSSGGYSDEVVHSFMGFAPANNPKFVVLVKLDNPQKEKFADSTAAPTFSLVTEYILNYYNIPPDK
jgi:cell division protein FtsI/penicillin-binding protein 2